VESRDAGGTEPPDPLLARVAQHVAPVAAEPARGAKKRRTRPVPRWRRDGTTHCVLCDEDNDPDHPNSPYCALHRKIVTSQTRPARGRTPRRPRRCSATPPRRAGHTFTNTGYAGPLGVSVQGPTADQVRALYGALLSALDLARVNTDGFKTAPNPDAEWVLKHLREVARAARALNEVLGPALYGPKTGG